MKENVQSIERAFDILDAIHRHTNGVGVGSLATETGLHTSTTSRIVRTLENIGAINRSNGKLFIGDAIVKLSRQAPWTEQLISLATPHLQALATVTQEAIGLTLVEGDECVVFYQIPSSHHIQIRDWTNERFPLHVTSSGKLYLAHLDEMGLARHLNKPLASFASETKVETAHLTAEFPQIRVERVAWTIDELEDGLTSVAAMIQSPQDEHFVGLYLSKPSFRFTKMIDRAKLAQQVLETAEKIKASI